MTLCLIRPRRRKLMTRIRLRYLDAACRACEAKTEACGDLGRLTPVKSPLFPTGGAAASAVGFAFGTAAAASGPTPSGSQHQRALEFTWRARHVPRPVKIRERQGPVRSGKGIVHGNRAFRGSHRARICLVRSEERRVGKECRSR